MDINLEKEKAKYIHKLELRRLIIDKILFGVIIVLIGLAANFILEQYRSKLTKQRFILEKRLEAINSIKEAYEDMHNLWDVFTLTCNKVPPALPVNYKEQYEEKINNFLLQSNRWNLLFSKEFGDKLGYYVWIHTAANYMDIKNFCRLKEEVRNKHRAFIVYLHEQFLSLCQAYLGLQGEKGQVQFTLEEWPHEKADRLGAVKFYEVNFEKWKKWKEKQEWRK